ncbi:Ger(x)C family spore germination protein [Brevibacillus migulae]|uniref:Ger(x)C family spore germination protein n=1 Tax=Brevibacillus migulae TaxID=1644114 RepID=UPI00106E49E8|nr:Ger(x)C family spore germination protein [Brevibacillus migulae]
MKQLTIWLILLSFSSITLAGCWDREELNEISLISGMAIDKGKNAKYRLSLEGVNAAELNPKTRSQGTPTVVYSIEGNSISELAHKTNIGLSRKAVFSHMRTVVISEQIARAGMLEFLDFMERDREIRNDFNIIVATECQAVDVLRMLYPLQRISTAKIHVQLDTLTKDWGGDPNIRLKDFVNAIVSKGREPVAAVVRIRGSKEKGASVDNIQKPTPDGLVEVIGFAVFKGEKMLGILPVHYSRVYLWTQDKLRRTSLTIPCQKNAYLNMRVYNSNTNVEVAYENGKPVIKVGIKVETRLDGSECEDPLEKVETTMKYETLTADYIRKEVASAIATIQKKYKADVFGFGEKMHIYAPKYYNKVKNQWDKEFARAQVKVQVIAKLRRTGLNTNSFLQQMKK